MSKKSFQLPKEFAEKWIEALESGEYKQADGTLLKMDYEYNESMDEPDYDKPITETCTYCCLGVAAKISDCEIKEIEGNDLLSDDEDFYLKKGIPEILLEIDDLNLVEILTKLNDTTYESNTKRWKEKFPDLKLLDKKFDIYGKIQYNFKEIAKFIKLNVEFI